MPAVSGLSFTRWHAPCRHRLTAWIRYRKPHGVVTCHRAPGQGAYPPAAGDTGDPCPAGEPLLKKGPRPGARGPQVVAAPLESAVSGDSAPGANIWSPSLAQGSSLATPVAEWPAWGAEVPVVVAPSAIFLHCAPFTLLAVRARPTPLPRRARPSESGAWGTPLKSEMFKYQRAVLHKVSVASWMPRGSPERWPYGEQASQTPLRGTAPGAQGWRGRSPGT